MTTLCPCGSGHALTGCCGPYLSGQMPPPTAEVLMRSRYTAYVLRDAAYLRATWHPAHCPADLHWGETPGPKWLGLEVRQHTPIDENHARVEFVARCKIGGKAQRLHEISRFERLDGRWVYVDGEFPENG